MAVKQKAFDITKNIVENIIEKPLETVLPDSMMPYSEYVLLDRALPRVEDGLKPVQRRILYSMYQLGIKPETPYKKSARVVGECLGKYHPHGDTSVYDAMVRMAQDYNMRMTLVDGHGNFGSIDGDSAAAMRYTEVRMRPLALELLRDIDKNTVKMVKNFDDTEDEPDILPGRFPNLLVNGAVGIAIGLATNIPPHNITEVIDGCVALIDKPSLTTKDMCSIVKGPDFPTGGFIVGGDYLTELYETGKGKVVIRAKCDIESADGDRQNIVVTEIPYSVNKEKLQKRIFELKELKKDIFANIMDVADESDRNGMRIVIKLKKGEDAVKTLNSLLKYSDLEYNCNVNMVAIANGKPKQMGILEILKYYLEFQKGIILKRSQNDIAIAKKREHIVEGYNIIIPAIDEVIAIIRSSANRAESKSRLRERFMLSEAQSEAILTLQLGHINKLDVYAYEKELAELKTRINYLSKVIGSVKEQYAVVRQELLEIRDKYKTKRLTTIVNSFDDIDIKPFDPTKRTVKRGFVAIDIDGGVKLVNSRNYLSANRDIPSSGYDGLATALAMVDNDNSVLIFGSQGNCYKADTDMLKEKRWNEIGLPLSAVFAGAPESEKAVFLISYNEEDIESKELYIYTKLGNVKKSALSAYIVNKTSYQVVSLKDNDEVIGGEFVYENSTIMFVSSDGQCVNSLTDEYPQQGRIAGGVIGINLNDGESVIYAEQTTVEPELAANGDTTYVPVGEIIVITDGGVGKRVVAREFDCMKRNRKGVRIIDIPDASSHAIFASKVLEPFNIAVVNTAKEVSVIETDQVRLDNRNSKGKPIIRGVKISKILKHIEQND